MSFIVAATYVALMALNQTKKRLLCESPGASSAVLFLEESLCMSCKSVEASCGPDKAAFSRAGRLRVLIDWAAETVHQLWWITDFAREEGPADQDLNLLTILCTRCELVEYSRRRIRKTLRGTCWRMCTQVCPFKTPHHIPFTVRI